MRGSEASASLTASAALYTSEIHLFRDIERGWCNLKETLIVLPVRFRSRFLQEIHLGFTNRDGVTGPALSDVMWPRWIGRVTCIRSRLDIVYFNNEFFVFLVQTVLTAIEKWSGGTTCSGKDHTVLLNWSMYRSSTILEKKRTRISQVSK